MKRMIGALMGILLVALFAAARLPRGDCPDRQGGCKTELERTART